MICAWYMAMSLTSDPGQKGVIVGDSTVLHSCYDVCTEIILVQRQS
jgi:hypothetical protein